VENERAPQEAVGGQAVIEGVMMKTPSSFSVAVRRPDGTLVVRHRPWRSLTRRFRPLGWPFVRGAVVLGESLSGGIDALRFSAEEAGGDEGGAPKKKARGTTALALLFPLLQADGPAGGRRRDSGSATANLALLLGFGLAILIFKVVPHVLAVASGLDPVDPLFHVVDGAVKLALVVGYIAAVSRMKDIQRVFAYHGAEHKAIRTFELGQPLTVDAARANSRLHPRCGTSFIIVVVLASVVVYMALSPLIPRAHGGLAFQVGLVLAKLILLVPIASVAYEINRAAGRHWQSPIARAVAWPGMLMQRVFTTREPTDDQLEVALAALRMALDLQGRAGETRTWSLDSFPGFDAFVASRQVAAGSPLTAGGPHA
jgi:uncharacterized protein YqhQ